MAEEWKYVIRGESELGEPMAVVAKIGLAGKAVIITVYIPVEED